MSSFKTNGEPNDFLTFHRDDARHLFFCNQESRDPFFDPKTKTWIITRPSDCREFISSEKLRPPSYATDYEVLSERFNFDFSNLVFAFSHIPLCLHGDQHARSRRMAGSFLAARKRLLEGRIPDIVDRHFSPFSHPCTLEIMSTVIEPMVHDCVCLVADIDADTSRVCQSVSVIFDRSGGLNKRQRMETEIASVRALISAQLGDDATDDEVGLRLAYFILGKDPLTGMLGESLHKLFQSTADLQLSQLKFPEHPPETGVPFIERVVASPFHFSNLEFSKGERVRIFLQSFAYTDPPSGRSNFFGAGSHACLGRPLSLEIWQCVTAFLSKIPLRASVLSYSPRESDYIFTCPAELVVQLCA